MDHLGIKNMSVRVVGTLRDLFQAQERALNRFLSRDQMAQGSVKVQKSIGNAILEMSSEIKDDLDALREDVRVLKWRTQDWTPYIRNKSKELPSFKAMLTYSLIVHIATRIFFPLATEYLTFFFCINSFATAIIAKLFNEHFWSYLE
jgi:hypothetical protein